MNKKKTVMIISLITGLLLLTLGVTYAIFNLSKIGEKNSKLIVGDIYMHYKDTTNAINIENAMPLKEGYVVNPIMQTQSDTRNELAKCIEIIEVSGMPLADGSTYESFCKGTGKTSNNEIFQEAVDSGTWFPDEMIHQFKNNNIITSDNKVNPVMNTQTYQDTRYKK